MKSISSVTVEQFPLYNGHLVRKCPLPPHLLNSLPNNSGREFTHTRYTAVTCKPEDFSKEKFYLRQILYDPPRPTELFIVITLYNEKEDLFLRTMQGVLKNITHFCSLETSEKWGEDAWKKIVVCIVADGREKYVKNIIHKLN